MDAIVVIFLLFTGFATGGLVGDMLRSREADRYFDLLIDLIDQYNSVKSRGDIEEKIQAELERIEDFNWCDCGVCRIKLPYEYGKLAALYWVLGEWSSDRREMSKRALDAGIAMEVFHDSVAEKCYDTIWKRGEWPSSSGKYKWRNRWWNLKWRLRVLFTGKVDELHIDTSHFVERFLDDD
jgi:hypothetical protein